VCKGCGNVMKDARHFVTNADHCWECASRLCSVCDKRRKAELFPGVKHRHATSRNQTMRCDDCYTCRQCSKKTHPKQFDGNSAVCKSCGNQILCSACGNHKPRQEYSGDSVKNNRKQGTSCVCMSCTSRGFSSRDTKAYKCRSGCEGGHRIFNFRDIYNIKSGAQEYLFCKQCLVRCAYIKSKLRSKGSWKCTCGGKVQQHKEKCELHPREY
jgi:hypothetical protein